MSSNEARDARDAGIQTATDHADRVCPEWKEQAYQAIVAYATTHPTFTIEQLRQSLNGQLADPPSLRAWGGIAQRARRAGIVEHFGWTEAEDPAVHCNVIRVWKSLTCPRPSPYMSIKLTDQQKEELLEALDRQPMQIVSIPADGFSMTTVDVSAEAQKCERDLLVHGVCYMHQGLRLDPMQVVVRRLEPVHGDRFAVSPENGT